MALVVVRPELVAGVHHHRHGQGLGAGDMKPLLARAQPQSVVSSQPQLSAGAQPHHGAALQLPEERLGRGW